MIGWDFEVDAYSRFWRWHLIKICVWTCDMNSTLRSVVPLAMFLIKKPNLLNRCHTRFLPGCYMNFLRHLFLPWSVFARFLFPRCVRSEFVRVVVGLVNWRVLGSKRHKKQSKKNKTRTVIVRDFELNLLGGTLTPEETLKSEEEKSKEWKEKHKCFWQMVTKLLFDGLDKVDQGEADIASRHAVINTSLFQMTGSDMYKGGVKLSPISTLILLTTVRATRNARHEDQSRESSDTWCEKYGRLELQWGTCGGKVLKLAKYARHCALQSCLTIEQEGGWRMAIWWWRATCTSIRFRLLYSMTTCW